MTLQVDLVSPERILFSGEADMVVARTTEGEIGILPGHEPMLAILAGGEVRVTLEGGEKITATADEGFLSVQSNSVQVVASRAELA